VDRSTDVTRMLAACAAGTAQLPNRLYTHVYDELHEIAEAHLRRERGGHTLQPTALVHEAYLKLIGNDSRYEGRRHFLAVASRAMRWILINHAKRRSADKRGGGGARVTLFEVATPFEERAEDLLRLDEALERLGAFDERASRVVEMRFFGGLSFDEIAQVLEVSPRTAERIWRVARAWLRTEVDVST